jgi:hypothetical protein
MGMVSGPWVPVLILGRRGLFAHVQECGLEVSNTHIHILHVQPVHTHARAFTHSACTPTCMHTHQSTQARIYKFN